MRKLLIILVFGLVAFSTSAYALTIDYVDGTWSNVLGMPEYQAYVDMCTGFQSSSLAYGNQSEDRVRWGLPTTSAGPRSGLGFTGVASDTAFDFGEVFEIGQLRHFNYEIYQKTAASTVDFSLSFGIAGLPVALSFDFTFTIDETPNQDAEGNKVPIDDIISFSDVTAIQTFVYDDTLYTFELLGFGGTPADFVTQFISTEFSTSSTKLFGRLTTEPVPEPSTVLLIGVGLVGLAALRRRAK